MIGLKKKISMFLCKKNLTRNAFISGMSLFILFFCIEACTNKPVVMNQDIDIQGHRGCRGLKPENTITAFKEAVDIGVKTLELDVVVKKNKDVIISHEPFFNHEISTGPKGEEITEENEKEHNMYEISLEEIQSYDVGMKAHPRFPMQKKMSVAKPTLKEMVTEIEAYVKVENYPFPEYIYVFNNRLSTH